MSEIVYAIEYSSCIHESGFETLSLHRTKRSLVKAMLLAKNKKFENDSIGMDEFEDNYYFVSKRISLEDEPMYAFRYRIIPVIP